MLSAVIYSQHSYSAVLLAEQQIHQRLVPPGPLVLGRSLLKYQRLQQIGDQPVSRSFSDITAGDGLYLRHCLLTCSLYGSRPCLGSLGIAPTELGFTDTS